MLALCRGSRSAAIRDGFGCLRRCCDTKRLRLDGSGRKPELAACTGKTLASRRLAKFTDSQPIYRSIRTAAQPHRAISVATSHRCVQLRSRMAPTTRSLLAALVVLHAAAASPAAD